MCDDETHVNMALEFVVAFAEDIALRRNPTLPGSAVYHTREIYKPLEEELKYNVH